MFLYELLQHAWVKRDTAGQNKSVVRKGLKACSSYITAGFVLRSWFGMESRGAQALFQWASELPCAAQSCCPKPSASEGIADISQQQKAEHCKTEYFRCTPAGWHGNLQHSNGNCMQRVIFEGFVRPGLVVQEAAAPERAALSHARLLAT